MTSEVSTHPAGSGLLRPWLLQVRRDVLVIWRQPSDWLSPLVFFFMAITLLPLGISPAANTLSLLAPGLLWVVALLANLLSLEGLFRSDYDDGSLEQLVLSPQPLYFMVLAKVLAYWLTTGLPLTLVAPLLALLLSLPTEGYSILVLSLLLGTIPLCLIGAIGAALTVSLRKGGVLLALIVMPLYVPVLIFGATSVRMAVDGMSAAMPLAVLGLFCVTSILLAPLAVLGALKLSVEA